MHRRGAEGLEILYEENRFALKYELGWIQRQIYVNWIFFNWYKFSTLMPTINIINTWIRIGNLRKLKWNLKISVFLLTSISIFSRASLHIMNCNLVRLWVCVFCVLRLRKTRAGTWTSGLKLNNRGHCKPKGILAICQSHVRCNKQKSPK